MSQPSTSHSGSPRILDEIEYVNPPSEYLGCPVCHEVFTDPLITTKCSHSFCAACIHQSLEIDGTCPLCRTKTLPEDLHPNIVISQLISELLIRCSFRQYGCSLQIRIDSMASHKQTCQFRPTACPSAALGCTFNSVAGKLEEHLRWCAFEQLKTYVEASNARMERLELLVVTQKRELAHLKVLVNKLKRRAKLGVNDAAILNNHDIKLDGNRKLNNHDGNDDDDDDDDDNDDNDDGGDYLGEKGENFPHGDTQCIRTISNPTCGVTSLAYSNGYIFAGGHDGGINIFDAESGVKVLTLSGHQMSVWAQAMYESSHRLFTAGSDNTIKAWDLDQCLQEYKSGKTLGPIEPVASLNSHEGKVYSLAIVGDRLYSASSDRTIKIWDINTLEEISSLMGHQGGVNCVISTADGRIATSANDKTIKIWDAATGTTLHTTPPNTSEVLNLAQGDRMLFSCTYDAVIHCYDLRDTTPHVKPLTNLVGHNWEVWQLEYAGGELFSGSFDHTVRRWDLRGYVDGGRGGSRSLGECTRVLKGHKGFVHAMTLGDGSLITGCADRTIKVWK